MLDYAQIQIFHAVKTYGRYQGCLLLIFILHNVMHAITLLYLSVTWPYSKMAAPCQSPEGARSDSAKIQWLWFNHCNCHSHGKCFFLVPAKETVVDGVMVVNRNLRICPTLFKTNIGNIQRYTSITLYATAPLYSIFIIIPWYHRMTR